SLTGVVPLNGSMAARDLGLLDATVAPNGQTLTGSDLNPAAGTLTLNRALSELNNNKGVGGGKAKTDVLLAGGLDGVLPVANPLGDPAGPAASYRVVPNETAPGGVKNNLRWSEFGLGLPNAQVTALHYTPPARVNGVDIGDVLVIATRGRGAY